MNLRITPTQLKGSITPPPSKSQAHRLIIAAALAEGESVISNVALSQDIRATLACMEALGAGTGMAGDDTLAVTGVGGGRAPCAGGTDGGGLPLLDCGESGSTLRFLIPIALALAGGGIFTGRGRLLARPQKPYADLFAEKGLRFVQEEGAITACGVLKPGVYELPGDVSSQFITGLLYALPLLEGDSEIRVTTGLESAGYVAMTLDALEQFGVTVDNDGWRTFRIPGNQTYRPRSLAVEADWSQAGFWYAAAGIGNQVAVTGMNEGSVQGDRALVEYRDFFFSAPPARRYTSVAQVPDLVPPLAVWAALTGGTTVLHSAGRLRMKESDRLATVTEVLRALGARVEEGPDSLTIEGRPSLSGGVSVSAHNDHRIAMMAAVAATRCERPVVIRGAECVAKSYPNFWEDYRFLGGQIEEVTA